MRALEGRGGVEKGVTGRDLLKRKWSDVASDVISVYDELKGHLEN